MYSLSIPKISTAILIGFIVYLVIHGIMNIEDPHPNPYGGYNNGSYVDDYMVVQVYDANGRMLCSYPISRHVKYSEMQELDCPDDLEQRIFLGDD